MKYYLGIDLGGTNIAAGVVDESHNFLAKYSIPTKAKRPFEEVVADLAVAGRHVLADAGLKETDISYVGIGTPSNINPANHHVIFANNLGWVDRDLAGEFQKHWDVPVFVANDADVAALGEVYNGAAKGYDNVLMITLGTGIGGGFVIGKKIFLGGDGFGCEPGHSVLVHDGFPCSCGNRGCFEVYASITGLIRETINYMRAYPKSVMWELCGNDLNKVSGRTAFEAAKQGDEGGLVVYDNYTGYLASGITSMINTFRPQAIIIGGGISREGDFLLEPVRKKVISRILAPNLMKPPEIIAAQLGGDAGILGAAMAGVK